MKELIVGKNCPVMKFIYEEDCRSGIKKIADKVREDVFRVTGVRPEAVNSYESGEDICVIFGITGESALIDKLEKDKKIDLSEVKGKREVYGFFVLEDINTIVIAGSDKRGTIYGLFHISDLMGVSPLADWSGVVPKKRDTFSFTAEDSLVSKEPSVEYRGFFINDEWPAFGNWCMKNFGGVNAKMYEHVFELLLRMKGNYLWPAMWASSFAVDGPGLESAELADEYGVVIGLSHHEPCLRHGEEYSKVRGKGSKYGDAWDFRSNREGITLFWKDGLKRNGHLENIITVGMRGERDSTILGSDATLKDNIDLLRDVLKVQNKLIRDEVNSDLSKVPRMLALYKEVEPYYYGDKQTKGLRYDKELDDVILMLCDDNHGYVRSLPDEEMRKHKGGFGMYYHFDYHGDPVSYEWINSTYLPEVWEQMTVCYEHGIKKLWIVNVGDLGLQEMPLSYFLDLAYDYDKWGIDHPDRTDEYMKNWMTLQFGAALDDEDIDRLAKMYTDYTRLMHMRRPEHLSEDVYSPQGFGEASYLLSKRIPAIVNTCKEIEEKLSDEYKTSYTELISYSVLAGMNLLEMWLCRTYDHFYASIGAVKANDYAKRISQCMQKDKELKDMLHTVGDGRFNGFGLAPHIGFKYWNAEESRNPVIETVIPVERADMTVGLLYEKGHTCGHEWTGKQLEINRFVKRRNKDGQPIRAAGFFTAQMGTQQIDYTVTCDKDWVILNKHSGTLTEDETLIKHFIILDEQKLLATAPNQVSVHDDAVIKVNFGKESVTINVHADAVKTSGEHKNIFHEENGLICVYAEHFTANVPVGDKEMKVIPELSRDCGAVKLFPVTANITGIGKAPYVEYTVDAAEQGEFNLIFRMQPNNPYRFGNTITIVYSVNSAGVKYMDTVSRMYTPGVTPDWAQGVLDHERSISGRVMLNKGLNKIRFYGISCEAVLQKLVLVRSGTVLPNSYLGPGETISY